MKVAGCDCGKGTLSVCVLSEAPANLKTFARSYKPLKLKSTREDIEKLIALNADLYILEPTGDYSKIWIAVLQKAGKEVRLVSPRRVRHYCEYLGLTNKADEPDAAAIAAYSLVHCDSQEAFLKIERIQVRQLVLRLNSLRRDKNPFQNQLGQILDSEFPLMVKTFEGADRGWLDPQPPALWRLLADEAMDSNSSDKRTKTFWANKQTTDIGEGLSPYAKAIAQQLCALERLEYSLELELAKELALPEYQRYMPIFERFEVPPKIRAVILSRIYPFEDFLRDGKAFKEYVNGANSRRKTGMTKRDRSEGEFKLTLGMGKTLYQSGTKTSWKASGARYARTALWQYVKVKVVIGRNHANGSAKGSFTSLVKVLEKTYRQDVSPWLNQDFVNAVAEKTGTTPDLASLRLHYEYQIDKTGDERTSATAGRFCRMLYKALLKGFATPG